MKSIAIFGGSFDPPHFGHQKVIDKALETLDIDKIILVPTFLNPFKSSSYLDPNKRLELCKSFFKNVEVSSYEVDQKRSVTTYESVLHFKSLGYENIYLIIGADNLKSLHTWASYDKLKELVNFVVATRDNIPIDSKYIKLEVDAKISSTQEREKMQDMQQRVSKITQVLDTNKAEAIETFDLKDKDYFVDQVIIASSLGNRHTTALLDHLKRGLKPEETFLYVDESPDWIAIDLGDILIHVMTPEFRSKYDLETFLSELSSQREED